MVIPEKHCIKFTFPAGASPGLGSNPTDLCQSEKWRAYSRATMMDRLLQYHCLVRWHGIVVMVVVVILMWFVGWRFLSNSIQTEADFLHRHVQLANQPAIGCIHDYSVLLYWAAADMSGLATRQSHLQNVIRMVDVTKHHQIGLFEGCSMVDISKQSDQSLVQLFWSCAIGELSLILRWSAKNRSAYYICNGSDRSCWNGWCQKRRENSYIHYVNRKTWCQKPCERR